MDWYGTSDSYIHLKFGDARKCYNFTDAFREKYPNFCAEYELYWYGSAKCRFNSPLEIAQYVDMFEVPVKFYYNYTDTPSKSIEDVYEYFIREYSGITLDHDGRYRDNYNQSLDDGEAKHKSYKVTKVEKK